MTDLPRSVRVGAFTYKVVCSQARADAAGIDTGAGSLYGATHHRSLEIVLHPEQHPMSLRDTLLHESLHGVNNVWCVFPDDREEEYVSRLAPALLAFIRDNPKLVAYLQG